jgi:hypothetical protein
LCIAKHPKVAATTGAKGRISGHVRLLLILLKYITRLQPEGYRKFWQTGVSGDGRKQKAVHRLATHGFRSK